MYSGNDSDQRVSNAPSFRAGKALIYFHAFRGKAFRPFCCVLPDTRIILSRKIPPMPKPQMAVYRRVPLAQCYQVFGIKLFLPVQMERKNVMHIELLFASANSACSVRSQMLFPNGRPFRAAFLSLCLLSFDSRARLHGAHAGIHPKKCTASPPHASPNRNGKIG